MSIQDLGSVGELIAAIATVATLIYLALQIRSNTEAVRASTIHGITETQQRELRWSSDISDVLTKAIEDPSSLDSSESWKLMEWLIAALAARQNEYVQYQRGFMDAEVWKASERIILMILSLQWARNWWVTMGRASYSTEFADLVDSLFDQDVVLVDFVEVLKQVQTGGV